MKLRLPHRLQAALVAALASVSFTTLSSGTLSAAFFFGSQAFAEEAADNPAATIDIGDTNLDPQAAIDEEEGKGEAKESGSAPINQAGFNGIYGSSDDADRAVATEVIAESSIDTENVGTAGQANYTGTSADLPSNDLGFTSNSYASGSSNGSVVDSPVTSFTQATAVPAVQQVQYVESTTPTTSSGTTTTGAATGGYSATPVSGATGGGGGYSLSAPAIPRAAVVTVPDAAEATAPAAESAKTDSGSADSTPADELGSTTPSLSVGGASLVRASYSAPAPAMLGATGDTSKHATWNFEGNMTATTSGITSDLTPEWKGGGSESYVDTGLYIGWESGGNVIGSNLGQAVTFDGSHYIRVTSGSTFSNGGDLPLDTTHAFTVSVWVKLDNANNERFILGTGDGNGGGFSLALKTGDLDFLAKGKAHHNFTDTPDLSTGKWYNFTITSDGTKTYGYVNGESIGDQDMSGWQFVQGSNLGIGSGSANDNQSNITGQIASLDIYGECLSANEVKAQYGMIALADVAEYTWNGQSGAAWENAVWSTSEADNQNFLAGSNAVFAADHAGTVNVNATTGAHNAVVTGDYTFNLADGITFSTYALTVNTDSSLTLTGGSAEVALNSLSGSGSLTFNSTGTAQLLGSSADYSGNVAIKDGTVAVKAQDALGTGTVTVEGGTLETHVALGKAITLSGGTLAGAGSNATYSGAITVSAASTIMTASSQTVTVSGLVSGSGSLTVDGTGTALLSGNNTGFTGDVIVKGGTVKVGNNSALGASGASHRIEVAANGTLDVNGSQGTNTEYTIVMNGGTLTNTGGDMGANLRQVANHLVLEADSKVKAQKNFGLIAQGHNATSIEMGGHTLTIDGPSTFYVINATITGGGAIDVHSGTLNFNGAGSGRGTFASNFVLSGGTLSGNDLTLANDIYIETQANSNMSLSVKRQGHDITFKGDANLTVSGNLTGVGAIAKEGAGALTLSGSLDVNGTILLDGGSLALNGAVTLNTNNIGAFEVFDSTGQTYSYEAKGSGFLSNPGQYYLVKGTGSATASHGTAITGGTYVDSTSKTKGAGDIIVTFTPAGTTYYVNQDMDTHEDVAEGGSYNILSATDVSIKKDVTLTAASSSDSFTPGAKLHGEGTYALASGSKVLNGNLSLGNDWAGSVALSGSITDVGLNYSTAGTGLATSTSSIELKGVTGWIQKSHNANIILTNPSASASALKLTNGSSGTAGITYFTGSISGSGDFEHAWDKNPVYFVMQGDLSQWTGKIIKSAGGVTEFTLSNNPGGTIAVGAMGNSGTLNINVTNNAPVTLTGNFAKGNGTLNVNVKDTTQATFTGSITNANLSVNAGASATMATDATITGITNNGTLAVTGGHTVKLINSADANLGSVVLSSGDSTTPTTIGMRGDGAARTYTIGNLAVSGQGHVSVISSNTGGQGYHAQVNITNLTNADDSPATIYLGNSAHANTSIYNINGGSFTGEIVLRGESDGGTRRTGYQFNDADVAANSVLTFDKAALGGTNILGLGLGADITVQGIRHAAGMTESTTIYSGAYTFGQNKDFVSYGTDVHTITIAGAGEYATSATVKNHVNLAMDGAGTQTFKGDMSAFDGTITVKDGTLALDSAVANAGAVAVNGGSLVLGNSLTTTSAMTVANGATLKLAGTDKLTVGGNLTLGGNLDVSNIAYAAGTTVNLASYSGVLDYSGATLKGLASGVQATLGDSDGHLTLTFATQPEPEFGNSLGKVMYVGDSITDGVDTQHSWRYSFFKILADEGIGQAEEGYFQNVHTNRQNAPFTDSYGNRTFANTHSAQASVRSYETAATETGTNRLGWSSIQNWLGQKATGRDGNAYTGPVYSGDAAPDTFFMLLGTNDLLSDYGNTLTDANYAAVVKAMFDYENGQFGGTNGTFDVILDSMLQANPKAKLVLLDMPTWYGYRTGNGAHAAQSDFDKMTAFNQVLRDWVATKADKANITVVNSSEGMIALADDKVNTGVRRMFIDDGLHPSNQGELIIAGNVAKALGYGGRTMGQARMGATGSAFTNLNLTPAQGGTVATTWAAAGLDVTGSYTVDISSLLVGDGGTPGEPGTWNTGELLSITVGNGSQQGVLKVNEAYIQWGNDILYSMDMSQNAEALRITYITGSDLPSGYSAGYFVWLGDMMIGESLESSAGSTNGVSISWSGSSPVTMGTVSAAAGAYAPALAPGHYENAEGLYLVGNTTAIIHWVQPTDDSIGYTGLGLTAKGEYNARTNATATGKSATGVYTSVTGGSNVAQLHANVGDYTGDVYMLVKDVTMQNNSGYYGWIAAHRGGTLTGDASVKVENSGNGKAMLFGADNGGTIKGNVYVEVNGGTFASYSNSNRASYAGSYKSNITGEARLVTTGGVFDDSIYGGVHDGGNTIGSTALDLRGGLFKGNVYGGGVAGTVNSGASVVISGDAVVNGNVYGGGVGGTVNGGTSVTLAGGLVRGNVYGGGAGDTVNGGTKVVLKDGAAVAGNIYGKTDSVQGGTVEFDATTGYRSTAFVLAQTVAFTHGATGTYASDFKVETVTLAGESQVTLNNLTFTACTMEIGEGSTLTLDGTLTLPKAADYTGNLILTDGMTLDLSGMNLSGMEEEPVKVLNSVGGNGSLTYGNLNSYEVLLGSTLSDSYTLSVDSDNNLLLTFDEPTDVLIWTGDNASGTGTWNEVSTNMPWKDIADAPQPFTTGSNVVFNNNVSNVANIESDLAAGTMVVQSGADVTLHTDPQVARTLDTTRLTVGDGATLTVDANVVLTTGTISGSGTVSLRDGTKLELTGGVDNNGTLNVGGGAIVKLAGTDMLAVQNLNLGTGSVIDVSNIEFTGDNNKVKIADIDGRLDFPSRNPEHSVPADLPVARVAVTNYQGDLTDVVHLVYAGEQHYSSSGIYYFTDAELFLVKENPGLYWNNRDGNGKLADGVWDADYNYTYQSQTIHHEGVANWNKALDPDATNTYIGLQQTAYFISEKEDSTVTISVAPNISNQTGQPGNTQVATMVIGGGGTFNFVRQNPLETYDIVMSSNKATSLIVREGTTAHFEMNVVPGEYSQFEIEQNAVLDILDSQYTEAGGGIIHNQGLFNYSTMGYIDLQAVVNEGVANIGRVWGEDGKMLVPDLPYVIMHITRVYNEPGAEMTLSADQILQKESSGCIIQNEGELTFRTDEAGWGLGLSAEVPVSGMGVVKTVGTAPIYFEASSGLPATVDGSALEAGAKLTDFSNRVTITDTTTLTAEDFVDDKDNRSTTVFHYSSQLGEHVVMGGNTTLDLNTGSQANPVYTMGEVHSATAGTDQNLIVRSGVTANVAGNVSLPDGKAQVAGGGKLTIGGATSTVGELAATGGGTAVVELNGATAEGTDLVLNAKRLSNTDSTSEGAPVATNLRVVNTKAVDTKSAQFNIGDATPEGGDYKGTLQYGVGADAASGSGMNLTIKDNNVAAGAILEAYYDEDAPQSASVNVIVDTAHAKVVGLTDNISGPDANRAMVVSGAGSTGNKILEITGDSTYTYAGKLGGNLDVTYSGDGSQTFEGGVDGFRGSVTVDNSNPANDSILSIQNAASVSITDLTIGSNDKLEIQNGSNVGKAVVSGTLTAKGESTTGSSGSASVLNGSLTLNDTAIYDVSAAGGTGGLNLTGALTIAQGAKLSDNDLAGVLGLGWFGKYDLAFGVTDMSSFGENIDWTQGVDASTVFGNEAFGGRKEEFYIRYSTATGTGGNGGNVGAVYIYRIPEPASGTLSLLALAALAARRRRK